MFERWINCLSTSVHTLVTTCGEHHFIFIGQCGYRSGISNTEPEALHAIFIFVYYWPNIKCVATEAEKTVYVGPIYLRRMQALHTQVSVL
jgi:hypothetical protein